jgi:hypothetical protein
LIRWSLAVSIGTIVLLVAAIFLAQWLIDTPSVRADLSKKLSQAVQGQVTWKHLDIRLLPLPHGVVRDAHFEMPDGIKVDVATVEVTLRLVPLFRGHAELKAVTVLQPNVDVWIGKSTDKDAAEPPSNPLDLYRKAMRPVLDAVARFAPETTLAIDQGRVALHMLDLPPFEASDLDLQIVTDAQGIAVNATTLGTYWDSVTIEGRMEYADLSAAVKVDATGLKPQAVLDGLLTNLREVLVLSDVGAQLEARTDGKTAINIALDLDLPRAALHRRGKQIQIMEVRVGGAVKFSDQDIEIALDKIHLGDLAPDARANLLLVGPTREPRIGVAIESLDLARLRDAVVTLAGDQPMVQQYISRIHGGHLRDLKLTTQAATFGELFSLPRLHGSVAVDNGSMLLPAVEREAKQFAAQVELIDGTLRVSAITARLGASQIRQASTTVVLTNPQRLTDTQAQGTFVLDDLLPRLRTKAAFAKTLQAVPELTGTTDVSVKSLALRFDRPAKAIYDLTVRPRSLRVRMAEFPAPLDLRGGSARITPRAIKIERIGVGMFASKALISGEVTEFRTNSPRVTARVVDGVADGKAIDWLWKRAAIAERFKPVTPISFAAQRVQWSDAGLDAQADVKFATGASLGVDLFTHDKTVILRRATFKDRDSDAVFTFATRDPLLEVGFTGVFAGRSLATIFGRAPEQYSGRISGDLQLTLDRELQRRSAARGTLTGEHLDLNNIVALPIKLERFDLQGDGDTLHIRELTANWAEQKMTLRGDIARRGNDLAIALEVDSPGIVLDALRSGLSETAAKPAPNANNTQPTSKQAKTEASFDPWSLPITGTVALRANFLEYKHYRSEGVRALVTLERNLATLGLSEGTLCGITMPLTFHATPRTFDVNVNLSANGQSLGGVAQCLQTKEVGITGSFDLSATLSAQGQLDTIADSLTKNLTGSLEFRAYAGEIRKLALLGNILSVKAVGDLLKGDVKLSDAGFKYRDITVRGKVGNGTVTLEQASLDSAALGLATTGTIKLDNYESRLTVLVAPFGRLDSIMRKIPIVGYVMGGALTSIPVGVSGDIRNPLVVPLGPGAVGSELVGIFERTFKLPGKMVEPLSTPKKK